MNFLLEQNGLFLSNAFRCCTVTDLIPKQKTMRHYSESLDLVKLFSISKLF